MVIMRQGKLPWPHFSFQWCALRMLFLLCTPTPCGSFGLTLLSGKAEVDGSREEHNHAGPVLRDIQRCLPLALFSTVASNMTSTSFYSFLEIFPSIPKPRLKKCSSFLLLGLSGLAVSLRLWGRGVCQSILLGLHAQRQEEVMGWLLLATEDGYMPCCGRHLGCRLWSV